MHIWLTTAIRRTAWVRTLWVPSSPCSLRLTLCSLLNCFSCINCTEQICDDYDDVNNDYVVDMMITDQQQSNFHTYIKPRGAPSEISAPPCRPPKKVQDKAATCQNYITYPVVPRESISFVPPRWKCRHPSAAQNENPRTATGSAYFTPTCLPVLNSLPRGVRSIFLFRRQIACACVSVETDRRIR